MKTILNGALVVFLACFLAACKTPSETVDSGPYVISSPDGSAPKDFQWVYYDYGELPLPEFALARDSVWERYGVQISGFGCEVSNTQLHTIKLHNDSLFALLQPQYPGVSEDRIMKEIALFEQRNKK